MANRPDTLTARAPRLGRTWPALAAIGLAQLAAFIWYLTVPLPNAQAVQTTLPDGSTGAEPLRRIYVVMQALPHVVPGVGWDDSLLGTALANLSHVENLGDRLPIVAAGLLIAAAAVGLGRWTLRAFAPGIPTQAAEQLALAYGIGATLLGALSLGLGRLGSLHPWAVRLGLAALALANLRRPTGPLRLPRLRAAVPLLPALPFLILMVLGSLQPSLDFDALEYHLQGPKEWYQAGRIAFLPHNVYTSMPFAVEMLHLLGMVVLDDWWRGALVGQFLIMTFAPLAAILIAGATSRCAGPRAAWVAALAYLGTPWIYRLSVFAYVEGPLAYYHAALLWVVAAQFSSSSQTAHPPKSAPVRSWAALLGLTAGGAMACKYPALISAVIPASLVAAIGAVRAGSPQALAWFAAGLALTIGPWLLKNQLDHRNPVYPLGYSVFGGAPWSEPREAKWRAAHGPRPITGTELIAGLADVAGRNDWQSPLYLMLAPLAALRPGSRRASGWLALYAAYLFATWWLLTHRLDRFWVPILPALACLAGIGADWSTRRGWSILLATVLAVGLFTTWIYDTTALAALNRWTDSLATLRRDVPALASPSLTWLDRNLPPGGKILLVGPAAVFHMDHPIVYNTVFDDETIETLARDRTPAEVAAALRQRGITHIWVDWSEIGRYRSPGNYGYTDFVTPALFDRLVAAGVLRPLTIPWRDKNLFVVADPGSG
ncbi:MAG: hypothetical protein KatS3mg108_0416 [Isosphaeraceae bacterium]|nr:MAG: hypothetical protein KatS3mg108_0416 [Isosphaeraceae bacterium]